jgi:hypothetical protein
LKSKVPSNTATSGTAQQKKKKTYLVEVEYTDSEDEAGSSQSPGAGPSKKKYLDKIAGRRVCKA